MVSGKINTNENSFTDQLLELISHFHASLKIIRLYPPEHTLVQKKTRDLHKILMNLFEQKKIVQFEIVKNTLFFEGMPLEQTNSACVGLAHFFSEHDIAVVTFNRGVTVNSLFRFLTAANTSSVQKEKEIGFEEKIARLNIPYILVRSRDYSEFDVANSRRNKSKKDSKKNVQPSIWTVYTDRLRDNWLKRHSGAQKLLAVNPDYDFSNPTTIASFLNNHANTDSQILIDFASLVDEMLEATALQPAGLCQTEGELLNSVLSHLHPIIRDQFLSSTLKTIDETSDKNNPELLLKGLSKNLLVGMLELVNQGNVTVSQALFNLVERVSHLDIPLTIQPETLNKRQLHALLQPERYKDFVDEEYHASLQKLSEKDSIGKIENMDLLLAEYLPTMEDNHIDEKITRAILILLEDVQNVSEFEDLVDYVMDFSYELPRIGLIKLLSSVQKMLQHHSKENKSENIQQLALEYLRELSDDEFIACIVRALPDLSHNKQAQLLDFVVLQGEAPLEGLVQVYCLEQEAVIISFLYKVFTESRVETLAIIFKIIQDQDISTVKKLLSLVQQLGVRGTVPLLKRLLQNKDEKIRFAVLELLLPLEEEGAINIVRDILNGNQDTMIDSAIDLCGQFRLSAMVPLLINLLDDQLYKKEIFKRNSQLIIALGEIGDKRAIPYLTKLVQSKFSFFPNRLLLMKETIFSSLKGYKPSVRQKLLSIGLKSKESRIRTICAQIELTGKQATDGKAV
jgi:HEAT repeat protein